MSQRGSRGQFGHLCSESLWNRNSLCAFLMSSWFLPGQEQNIQQWETEQTQRARISVFCIYLGPFVNNMQVLSTMFLERVAGSIEEGRGDDFQGLTDSFYLKSWKRMWTQLHSGINPQVRNFIKCSFKVPPSKFRFVWPLPLLLLYEPTELSHKYPLCAISSTQDAWEKMRSTISTRETIWQRLQRLHRHWYHL